MRSGNDQVRLLKMHVAFLGSHMMIGLFFFSGMMMTCKHLTVSFLLFQPKSDLAALLQILCGIFAQQSPVYAKSAPTPPQPSSYNMPQQPSYLPQYGGYSPNPGAMPPYPVGTSTGMPMPQPGPVPGKFTPVVMIKMLFTYFIFSTT